MRHYTKEVGLQEKGIFEGMPTDSLIQVNVGIFYQAQFIETAAEA